MRATRSVRACIPMRPLDIPHDMNASLNLRKKKLLRWSQQRGMLENDILLGTYAIKRLKEMSETETDEFETILNSPDPDVFQWLTKKVPPPENLQTSKILRELQEWTQSNPLGYGKKQ